MERLTRLLAQNSPRLYANLQITNREATLPLLQKLSQEVESLVKIVESGDHEEFEEVYSGCRDFIAPDHLYRGSELFAQLRRLMIDLDEENRVTLESKNDRAGLLYEILEHFKAQSINLTSIHSFTIGDDTAPDKKKYQFQVGFAKPRASKEIKDTLITLEKAMGDSVEILPF